MAELRVVILSRTTGSGKYLFISFLFLFCLSTNGASRISLIQDLGYHAVAKCIYVNFLKEYGVVNPTAYLGAHRFPWCVFISVHLLTQRPGRITLHEHSHTHYVFRTPFFFKDAVLTELYHASKESIESANK